MISLISFLAAVVFTVLYWLSSRYKNPKTLHLAKVRLYLHLAGMLCIGVIAAIDLHLLLAVSLWLILPFVLTVVVFAYLIRELFMIMSQLEELDAKS